MATAAVFAEQVIRELLGNRRVYRDRLSASMTTAATTLTLAFANTVRDGDFLEIEDELMYVWDSTTLEVERAERGTTAAQHVTSTVVQIRPQHTKEGIYRSIEEEIKSWPFDICDITRADISFGATDLEKTLTGVSWDDLTYVFLARKAETDSTLPDTKVPIKVERDASGDAVLLHIPRSIGEARTVEVTYGTRLNPTITSASDLSTILPAHLQLDDVLRVGVMARELLKIDPMRAQIDAQATSRRPEEVPPTFGSQLVNQLREIRRQRLAEEAKRVRAMFPYGQRIWSGIGNAARTTS